MPPSKRGGMTVYVAFARSLMTSVDAPTVPAPVEVVNGSSRRHHSRTELPSCVMMAVISRNVPFALLEMGKPLNAKAEAVPTRSGAVTLRNCIKLLWAVCWTLERRTVASP